MNVFQPIRLMRFKSPLTCLSPRTSACFLAFSILLSMAFDTQPLLAQESGNESTPNEMRRAQLEKLRAQMANQLQLQAYDLLDELVFSWMQKPPFAKQTPIILADVIVPIGYGSGLEALLETHLSQLLIQNSKTQVQLAHCPACTALLVHSDSTATLISRGIDNPKALQQIRGGTGAEHALFLDFEAEGTALVLRARITHLQTNLPIVYARTLSTRISQAALLRKPDQLLSAEQARKEYEAVLSGRGPISIPVRFVLSAFSPSQDAALPVPIPIPWLQVGGEMAMSSARAWTGSLMLGMTYIPTVQTGLMVQGRIYRLLTGSSFSLTRPDVYAFLGVSLAAIQGATATAIAPTTQTNQLLNLVGILGTIATYPSMQMGLEMRINNRIMVGFVTEWMPTLQDSQNIGDWLSKVDPGFGSGPIQMNSLGMEVTFAF